MVVEEECVSKFGVKKVFSIVSCGDTYNYDSMASASPNSFTVESRDDVIMNLAPSPNATPVTSSSWEP